MKTEVVHLFQAGEFVFYKGNEYTIQYTDMSNDRKPTYAIQILKWEGLKRMDEVFIIQVPEADLAKSEDIPVAQAA